MHDKTTWVVVPAYNEVAVIGDTMVGLRRYFQRVVVVDDFSSDDTASAALAAGAYVCRHPVNLGQGASLQTGLDFALAQGATTLVTFDADGQHRPEDAAEMVERLRADELDVVLASRFLGSTVGMTASRGVLLRLATAYTRITTGLRLTDTHNGLRVFSRSAAEGIRMKQNRMAHASEILAQIAQRNLRFSEHPVTILYTDYSRRKGQRMSGSLAILFDLLLGRLYR